MPFNLTLVLSVPHVYSRFSLKNGKRYPDARLSRYFFYFFPRSFLEYFCSLLVGNGNLVIFLVMYLNSALDLFIF